MSGLEFAIASTCLVAFEIVAVTVIAILLDKAQRR